MPFNSCTMRNRHHRQAGRKKNRIEQTGKKKSPMFEYAVQICSPVVSIVISVLILLLPHGPATARELGDDGFKGRPESTTHTTLAIQLTVDFKLVSLDCECFWGL